MGVVELRAVYQTVVQNYMAQRQELVSLMAEMMRDRQLPYNPDLLVFGPPACVNDYNTEIGIVAEIQRIVALHADVYKQHIDLSQRKHLLTGSWYEWQANRALQFSNDMRALEPFMVNKYVPRNQA